MAVTIPHADEQTHILVIDDQLESRMLAGLCLEELGFRNVHEVEDARTALEYVAGAQNAGNPVQLILCDHQMPEISGFQFFRVLQNTESLTRIPVLMISAQQSADLVRNLATHGLKHYITKPVTAEVLATKLTLMFAEMARD